MAPDVGILRSLSKTNLDSALGLMRGNKILIIESKLTPILDLIAGYQFLRDHGVVKIIQLEASETPQPSKGCSQALFLIRSSLVSAKLVCDQINSNNSNPNIKQGVDITYGVIVVPRQLHIITALFESEGVYELVKFGQYAYDLIPLDDHILSLQYDDIVSNFWLHRDTSYLPSVAKAIFNLRGIYGEFPHLIALGPYARSVVNIMDEFEVIYKNSLPQRIQSSEIPTVIIIDRALDMVSPLLTPLTYEAMLDEIFGIKGTTITFESDVTGKPDPVKHSLTSADEVFEKVRNLHFSAVVSQLLTESKKLNDERKQCSSGLMDAKSMKEFVEKRLKSIQMYQRTLGLHLGALDVIIKAKANQIRKQMELEDSIISNTGHREIHSFLEDSMAKGIDPIAILRLIVLTALAQDGVRDFRGIKTQFIQSYGFHHLSTFHRLEKMDLVYPFRGVEATAKGVAQVLTKVVNTTTSSVTSAAGSSSKPTVPFQTVLKKLIPPSSVEISFDSPDHSSYVFNGKFTPLVAKVVEEILPVLAAPKNNTTFIEKKLEELTKLYHISDNTIRIGKGSDAYGHGRNALVFIVGGITRVEIAALQLIGKKNDLNFNIICGGTDITNGKKIIQEVMAS